ncbi:MAG: DNA-binding response OmpR family regulator [Desulforhopalus sp.]|jgi:DNA-binding response OmpR family regulator
MKQANIFFLGAKSDFFDQLKQLIETKDIRVKRAKTIPDLIESVNKTPPYLIIADCPDKSVAGLTLCQEIRSLYQGLLILLSDHTEVEFHILALGLGADASLVHEHGALLLAANIEAMLRRCETLHPIKKLTFGTLTIDASKRDVFIDGKAVALSTIEFQLLWSLAQRHGTVVTRDEIHQELYQTTYNGYDRSIDLYVSRIRQKIGDAPGASKYVKTVRGVGYQFIPVDECDSLMQHA